MDFVVALLPSVGVGALFAVIMRAILLADRRERAAMREFDEAHSSNQSRDEGDVEGG